MILYEFRWVPKKPTKIEEKVKSKSALTEPLHIFGTDNREDIFRASVEAPTLNKISKAQK